MSDLGSLYFQLGLDDKKFNDAIEAAKQKVKELGADVEIGVKLDLEGLKKEIQNAAKAAGGGSLEIGAKVKADGLENLYSMLEASKKEAKELEEAIAKTTAASVRVQKQADLDSVRKRIADQEARILAKGGSLDTPKSTIVKVELDEESINQVKARLAQLEAPITPKVSIEYDQEKFRAVATTLENYTKRLNELGTVRLGIDDSFIRTGVGQNKKGLNGWLSNVSDYLLGDDTGDAGKSIKSIQKILDNYTFKVKAEVDAQKLVASISGAVKKVPVDINVDIEAVKKKLKQLGVPLNFNMTQAIADAKTKLKDQEFKAKLNLVIDKAKVSKVIKEAFAKKGLEYQATPSDVRNARILEIQQRMEHRQQKFNGQVKKSNASMRKLGSITRNASDWAGQLSNQFNNLVSFYALERFIRNLYTIGGEFQKQQIALQNMIGDVDRGNAIFERMKDLAVKSPFTFSDLASYTKQMSAYGIEYENLYDTTKRLADISAGVGVDMGRLILAFGQVRSAAVLRGQELRQFTEAGIPLVAELAKKFTELEGRVVSTGEVFDKISKREVSFGMVKDILFDMADPGGRFFETQEKLAESLAGKWSNLKDAWDIMIADIANGNNSVLSGLADIINSLIRGFETWLPFVSGAVVALGLLRGAITAVNIVSTANPWVLIGSVMAGVVSTIISLASETETATELITRLNRELEGAVAQNNDNERNANRYLDILKKQADSESDKYVLYQKQKAAFEELLKLYPKATEIAELELMTLEEIEKTRKRIAEQTKKDNLNQYDVRIDEAYDAYEKKRIETEKILRDSGKTIEDFPETKKELEALYNLYTNAMNAKEMYEQSFIDAARPKPLADWQIKADEIIAKYPNIAALKRDKGDDIWAYFDFLEATFKEAKEKYDRVTSESMKKPYKAIMDAVNAVNMGIGGVSLYDEGKKRKNKTAKNEGKDWAKLFAEGIKEELSDIASSWDLYKQLFELTGDREFASTAFTVTPVWDEAANQMLNKFKEAASSKGIDWDIDFDISDTSAKEVYGDLYDSWKQIKERIEKNGIDLKINTANAIKNTQTIEDKIDSLINQMNADLAVQEGLFGKDSIEYKSAAENWEKQIQDLKTELWELSPAFKEVFKDTVGMSIGQIEKLKKETQSIIDAINDGTPNEKTGMIDFIYGGKNYSTDEEGLNKLMELLDKLSEKSHTVSNNFRRVWSYIAGKEYEEQGKLKFGDIAGDLASIASGASEASQSLSDMFDALGDSKTALKFDLAGDIFGGVSKIGQGIAAKDPFAVIGGITGIITSIAQHHDKKLDRVIQKSQLEVQKLSDEYKNLETTIERQLGSVTAGQASKMMDSLKKQRSEIQKQYEAEDDKKKTDKSKLEDYKQQMAELNDQISHFYDDLASEQYGVDMKGWASQLASALTDAFASGEDAAMAFDNTVGDILRSLATEAIKLQFIEPAMANLKSYMFGQNGIFTDNSESGTDLSANEATGLGRELDKLKGQIAASNDYWDKINDAVGGILDETESNGKNGLSKDIQSVTEDTAHLLGSYLNSIRQDSSVQRTLIEQLVSVDVPQMSIIAQAQLQQLQQVAVNTKRNADAADRIYELVNKVVDKGSNKLKI